MKYIIQQWPKEDDGILFSIQQLEEMLFHYSDDIVKAPIHNTATLILEYSKLLKDSNIHQYHLDVVAEELINSLQNDLILKERIGGKTLQNIIESLKRRQRDSIKYIEGCISLKDYHEWCVEFIFKNVCIPNAKTNIRFGLRVWISSVVCMGYTPSYIYHYLKSTFSDSINNPLQVFTKFIQHFNQEKREFRVYFMFKGAAEPYKNLLRLRLGIVFDDDGSFEYWKKKNQSFVGYMDVSDLDPYCAAQQGNDRLDIFVSFFRMLSNRKKELISKNVIVRNLLTEEIISLLVKPDGYKAIEIEPKINLAQQIDNVVLGCQSKPRKTYLRLKKMISLHNMALQQIDLADGFVNLWSTLEVVSGDSEIKSTIDAVIDSVLPILQGDFFVKYFECILADIESALSKPDYNQLMNGVSQGEDELSKLMALIFLPEYDELLQKTFNQLSYYPNIRQKIYRLNALKNDRREVYKLSEDYANRLRWHLYRLYRVRNGIVHAGETDRYIRVLCEHLHIYCDNIVLEIIVKLSMEPCFKTVRDVLMDTMLLNTVKKEYFAKSGAISVDDINYLRTKSFIEICRANH